MPTNYTPSLWEQEDNQIISLMLNSIDSHIGSSCIYLLSAKDIWNHLSHMYFGTGNIIRIYEVCKQYFGLEQGDQTMDEYYNQISSERTGERTAFIAARGSYGSSRGGHGGRGGCGFRGGCDYRGGGCIGGRGPRKCTHYGHTNHFVDFYWDLHGTPSGFANQVASHDDSPTPSRPPVNLSSHFENDLISIPKDEYAQFLTRKRASTSSTVTLA
jgi:hypothetical protein